MHESIISINYRKYHASIPICIGNSAATRKGDVFMYYTGAIWRPLYEAASLLSGVTAGCTHHKFLLYDKLAVIAELIYKKLPSVKSIVS